jgi:hypothetical protein
MMTNVLSDVRDALRALRRQLSFAVADCRYAPSGVNRHSH